MKQPNAYKMLLTLCVRACVCVCARACVTRQWYSLALIVLEWSIIYFKRVLVNI